MAGLRGKEREVRDSEAENGKCRPNWDSTLPVKADNDIAGV